MIGSTERGDDFTIQEKKKKLGNGEMARKIVNGCL